MRDIIGRSELVSKGRRVGRIAGMRRSAQGARLGVRRCVAAVFAAARWAHCWETAVSARRVWACGAAQRRFSWRRVGHIAGMRWSARVRLGVRRCAAAVSVMARWAHCWDAAVGARRVRRCAAAVFMAARWAHCWETAVGVGALVRRCAAAVFVMVRWAHCWETAVGARRVWACGAVWRRFSWRRVGRIAGMRRSARVRVRACGAVWRRFSWRRVGRIAGRWSLRVRSGGRGAAAFLEHTPV